MKILFIALFLALFTTTSFADETNTGAGNSTRLTLRSTTSGNNGSTVRWENSVLTRLFSLGTDYNGNATQDFWLYDNVNGVTNLYISNAGTSYLSFGTSAGGIQYAESNDELGLFAGGNTRLRLTSGAMKVSAHPYYQRRASGTAMPTLGTNCGGWTWSSWANADSGDVRGAIQLGYYASQCTMSFAVPWDLSVSVGTPICTANSSITGQSVAITAIDDHSVTFQTSTSGSSIAPIIYYHCDGVLPPP
jgi:hypothetical protein